MSWNISETFSTSKLNLLCVSPTTVMTFLARGSLFGSNTRTVEIVSTKTSFFTISSEEPKLSSLLFCTQLRFVFRSFPFKTSAIAKSLSSTHLPILYTLSAKSFASRFGAADNVASIKFVKSSPGRLPSVGD